MGIWVNMRLPRLLFLLFCFIFIPILYTLCSALFASPQVATPNALAGRTTGFHALFSFNLPSSLFPPSAVISLTDDNSTFFLSRPAAFGPSLPKEGLSGQIWVGNGFGEGVEGELGCSDIPGWRGGDTLYNHDKPLGSEKSSGKSVSGTGTGTTDSQHHRVPASDSQRLSYGGYAPSTNDGTDDYLHHPLRESEAMHAGMYEGSGDYSPTRQGTHADVQSLQESAEIAGKVVLLSRGGCGFLEKVKWAQRRGGVAVIVGDDTTGGSLVTMYARGDTSNVTIPALFTSHTTAHLLSSLVPPQLAAQASRAEELKASRAKGSSSSTPSAQNADSLATPSFTPLPTSTPMSAVDTPQGASHKEDAGLFHALLALVGMSGNGHAWHATPEKNDRQSSNGNVDWVLMDSWDQLESVDRENGARKSSSTSKSRKQASKMDANIDGDGFVIGLHDWRDPDQAPARRNSVPVSSAAFGQETSPAQPKQQGSTSTGPKGGSVTPGSGEYVDVEKSSFEKHVKAQQAASQGTRGDADAEYKAPGERWLSRRVSRTNDDESGIDSSRRGPDVSTHEKKSDTSSQDSRTTSSESHEGLWVTLTPTSMSTSPFFDTLLVLVVSPLLTLSIVYILLLIRSRIRRRRWRAPKSVVERLPVRTYHTISTPSSEDSVSLSSPYTDSPAVPLLSDQRPENQGSRSQPPMTSGSAPEPRTLRSKVEKSRSGSRLWRRKYTGRQVECVVCLEEYIDGESRVMSLPCGHEFHAECITPWLTTRRRTCPICKGDVVRSMSQHHSDESSAHDAEQRALSAPVLVAGSTEEENPDTDSNTGLLEEQATSAPATGWRNLANLGWSAISGDAMWNEARLMRNRY